MDSPLAAVGGSLPDVSAHGDLGRECDSIARISFNLRRYQQRKTELTPLGVTCVGASPTSRDARHSGCSGSDEASAVE